MWRNSRPARTGWRRRTCGLPATGVMGDRRARKGVTRRHRHQVALVGPFDEERPWQAKANTGCDVRPVRVDWAAHVVTCARGPASVRWDESVDTTRDRPLMHVGCAAADGRPCPARAHCTRAKTGARGLTLPPQAAHDATRMPRDRQQTPECKAVDAPRAGIAGTLSQGVRAFGLRPARERGVATRHLPHLAPAAALTVRRVADWLSDVPRAPTRRSPVAALASTDCAAVPAALRIRQQYPCSGWTWCCHW
jgi:transposase